MAFPRVLSLFALAALGCSGTITDNGAEVPPGSAATGGTGAADGAGGAKGGSAGKGGGSTGGSSGTSGTTSGPVTGVATLTRVARLTHGQYQNTVNDLFGIEDDSTAAFAPDALNGASFDTSVDFRVDARLGPQYRTAAEALAQRAVSDDAVFKRIVTCNTADAACPSTFIRAFGTRAFRHPISDDDVSRFTALFAQGPDLVGSGDAFRDGVSLVVEAMLQSPQFLYRTELGAVQATNKPAGLLALDDYDLASRLSYFLWGTMPSDELFQRAGDGALHTPEQIAALADALLADARATGVAVSFHDQAWAFSRFARISPDAKTFPKAPSDLVTRVTDAAHAFVGDVVENDGGLGELLTAPYAFADSATAPLYGKTLSGSGLQRVDFAAGERQGILMQLGFLASNAYAMKTDPIHRGLFVLRNLLCNADIGDPPAGASQTPPPKTDNPPKTTRGEVALLTGQDACKGCHSLINPPGFAFEGFDAVGQARKDEDGEPLDTTGSIELDGTEIAFKDAFELVQAVAGSQAARSCYASKWLEFAYGRKFSTLDGQAETSLAANPQSARALMKAITQTDAFLTRTANEVAP
ncbi:MAG TPA: DUF1592 domain-containing protein [Polyangiaceae bacterium]|nr:DUF1592 domain-containing protein [Polyangiaceae bacterium]